jgi:polyribonucleotide nucleotidyltransferase
VIWDETDRKLSLQGDRLTFDQRLALLSLCDQAEYQRAVNYLYRRANRLKVEIIDITGGKVLEEYAKRKEAAPVKVISMSSKGALLEAEGGYRTWLPKYKLIPDPSEDLEDHLKPGDVKHLFIKSISPLEGELDATVIRPEEEPVHAYAVGDMVTGFVERFLEDYAAFISLKPGFDGFLHVKEVSHQQVEAISDVLHVGQLVIARVIGIDKEKRELSLSLTKLYDKEIYIPESHMHLFRGKHWSAVKQIKQDTHSSITLSDDGFCLIQGPSPAALTEAARIIERILATRIVQITIAHDDQRFLLVGEKGVTINAITEKTGSTVDVDWENRKITIEADTDEILENTLKLIEQAVVFTEYKLSVGDGNVLKIIGRGGDTIEKIRDDSGARIEIVDKEGIYIRSSDTQTLSVAEDMIRSVNNTVEITEITTYSLPAYQEIRTPRPTKTKGDGNKEQKSMPPEWDAYFSEERNRQHEEITKRAGETMPAQEYFSALSGDLQSPEIVREAINVSSQQLAMLTKPRGDDFEKYLGLEKSHLQKIQEDTGAEIEADLDSNRIIVSALSPVSVAIAIEKIESTLSL